MENCYFCHRLVGTLVIQLRFPLVGDDYDYEYAHPECIEDARRFCEFAAKVDAA